jgi:hypothetical protein
MRGGKHRQVTLDLAPDVVQGDAEHFLLTAEQVHLYALGAAAWGEAVLGDGFRGAPVARITMIR